MHTIRFRMTLWYAALLLAGFAALGALLYAHLRGQLYADLDSHLRAQAEFVSGYLAISPADPDFNDLRDELVEHATPRTLPMLVEVRRAAQTLMRSPNLKDFERLPMPRGGLQSLVFRTTPHRCFAADAHGYTILIAAPEETERRTLRQLLLTLLLIAPLVALFASVGGWFLAGRLLHPVDALTRRAQQIGAQDLSARLTAPATQDEIARLAQTLNDMLARLDAAFAQLRQFAADASHELRTPLTAMRGEVEVTLRQRRPPDEYERTLASLLDDIAHLSKIVDDLFTLSQADAGRLTLEKSLVHLDALARDVTERCQPLAESKGISLTCDAQSVALTADESRLRQLLFNLIDNAVKYTPEGGRVSVTVTEEGRGKKGKEGEDNSDLSFLLSPSSSFPSVVLSVTDTGIGIPPEHLPHIFDRFYRVDKARSREMGGSGLGLSICRWIAEAHGGTITVTCPPGAGSAFTVRLPLEH